MSKTVSLGAGSASKPPSGRRSSSGWPRCLSTCALRLGVTLPGIRELLSELPPDAVEQGNAKIPRDKVTGELKFPKNGAFNGYTNLYWFTKWAEEAMEGQPDGDGLAVCEWLQKQGSPHAWARPPTL